MTDLPARQDDPPSQFNPLETPAQLPALLGVELFGPRRQATPRQFWLEWFGGDTYTAEELAPHRRALAWRIVREMCILRGVLESPTQSLREATNFNPSPWTSPFHFMSQISPDKVVADVCCESKLPLMPPHLARLLEGNLRDSYDPSKDNKLRAFLQMCEHIAVQRLRCAGSETGRLGMRQMFSPEECHEAWPHPREITEFEDVMVKMTYVKIVSTEQGGGEAEAEAELRTRYALLDHEVDQVMGMARKRAPRELGLDDPRVFFALRMAKMAALAEKQTTREDYRGAAQTHRDMLRLANMQKDDNDEDYDGIVEREVDNARRRKLARRTEDDV